MTGYTRKDNGEKTKVPGLGGSFTYARLGRRLFGEYRDLGDKYPPFEEIAKYIFYTETSGEFDPKQINEKTGKIGEHAGASYYLLYTPDGKKDRALDMGWLKAIEKDKTEKNRRLIVYCEKLWAHRDEIALWEKQANRSVRPMLVPFNLK